ncbi:MAG: DMT family protein [Candidatus Sumerlaeia bacterium]|nr:DMT family protein [Candidatus Sumerlaeia bacterium]
MATVLLLFASNVFMTFAWYGHLKFENVPLWKVVLISWGIAFFEYCLMVPANRLGYGRFSAFELKIIQEVITLTVFIGFALLWLREAPRWNHLAAFFLVFLAVWVAFLPQKKEPGGGAPPTAIGAGPPAAP